ncbi:MAG: polyprenyl synthetase family protein [Planctomycetota bacterium]
MGTLVLVIPASDTSTASRETASRTAAAIYDEARGSFVATIDLALRDACNALGDGCPDRLAEAVRYALLAPGKRMRPTLVLMAAEACGGEIAAAMPAAVAVEMIHAYSLIHDDLPAMDDDDLRRGRPTVHIQFDEATAILAGDCLQPLAVQQIVEGVADASLAARAIGILVTAAGPEQLVGGQADDLAVESGQLPESVREALSHRSSEPSSEPSTGDRVLLDFLEQVHRRKTGALFRASLELGGLLGGGTPEQQRALQRFADQVGLAFQVVDDLLDHTAEEASMGKRVGKDLERGKLTYPGLLGVDRTRERARQLVNDAKCELKFFGPAAWRLASLADYVLERTN